MTNVNSLYVSCRNMWHRDFLQYDIPYEISRQFSHLFGHLSVYYWEVITVSVVIHVCTIPVNSNSLRCVGIYILLHEWEGSTGEYSVQGWQYWPDRREGQYKSWEPNILLYCLT